MWGYHLDFKDIDENSWKQGEVSIKKLLALAKELKSEQGDNPEYDRALVELIVDVVGLSMSDRSLVAAAIGIKPNTPSGKAVD